MKKVVKKMVKKVAMFENLKQGMFEEIRVKVCDFLINDCDICPKFFSSRCKEPCNDRNDKEAETKAPKGWITLKMGSIENDVYINTSTIVGVSVRSGASEALTEIYTIGAEDNPWLVEESIDKVMEKIKKS